MGNNNNLEKLTRKTAKLKMERKIAEIGKDLKNGGKTR